MVGAIFAPNPNNSDQFLATWCKVVCNFFFPSFDGELMIAQDPDGLSKGKHKHESWFVPRGKKKCQVCFQADVRWLNCFVFWKQVIEDMEHAIQMGLRAEEIVYTFQLPHPR